MPKAYASVVLDRSAEDVWATIRDFNALPEWHPDIAESRIEEGKSSDQVGCIRSFSTNDGDHIRERLLELSDLRRSYTYNFETTPFDVENYLATLQVTPITETGGAFVEWWATFDCHRAESAEWIQKFSGGVFATGFRGIVAACL